MDSKHYVITVNAEGIPENHSTLHIYISNKYEYDKNDKDDYMGLTYRKDVRKVSGVKHLRDGYKYLAAITGKFKNKINILVHVSDTEESYWESC